MINEIIQRAIKCIDYNIKNCSERFITQFCVLYQHNDHKTKADFIIAMKNFLESKHTLKKVFIVESQSDLEVKFEENCYLIFDHEEIVNNTTKEELANVYIKVNEISHTNKTLGRNIVHLLNGNDLIQKLINNSDFIITI
jgi:hypothetical protein